MADTHPDPMAAMIQTWRQAADAYIAAFGQVNNEFSTSPAGEEMARESAKTYLGSRASLAEFTRTTYEPLVEMAGGVPLTEFRRLMDLVQGLHLRLDRIDDALAQIKAGVPPANGQLEEKRRKKKA